MNKNSRANLLMRALVFSDEDAAAYGQYLTELPEEKQSELTYEAYVQDCNDRRAQACSVFEMNNAGFHAEITLDKANLVFFSVPYDDGFTAYVNGEQTDIVRVDDGMMGGAVPGGHQQHRLCVSGRRPCPEPHGNAGRPAGMAGVHGILCVAQA